MNPEDGVVAWWQCPDCGLVWGSFDERRQADREWCSNGCMAFPEETMRPETPKEN